VTDDAAGRTGGRRGAGTSAVLAASAVSGVSGYVVLVVVARHLTPAENASFLVFWGALFGVFSLLIGIATETTRAVHATGHAPARTGSRLLPEVALLTGCVALVLAVSGLVWAPRLLGPAWHGLLAALVVGSVLFASHCFVAGASAGRGDLSMYSLLVGAEATARLVLVGSAVLAGAVVGGLAWVVALACGTWLLLAALLPARTRGTATLRGDVPRAGLRRRLVAACVASGASGLLLVGFPVLLRLTTPDDVFDGAAPLILAVSLSRAPLLVPLNAFQNVLVTRVASHGVAALRRPLVLVVVAALVGAALAVPVGPAVLHVINPAYDVAGPVFGLLVLGAGAVGMLVLTGAATIARDHHAVYVAGYVVATVVSVLGLLLPLGLDTRVVSSLLVGPLVGVGVHVALGLRPAATAVPVATKGTP
jgi:hypothetical protein